LSIVTKTSSGDALPGGTVEIHRVAKWKETADGFIWELSEPFQTCGIPVEGLEENDNAESLARFAKEKSVSGTAAELGAEGKARFGDIPSGLYLIVQTQAAPGYRAFSPFLVSLPFYSASEASYSYYLTTVPKVAPLPASPPSDVPDPPAPTPTPTPPPLSTPPPQATMPPGDPTGPVDPADPASPDDADIPDRVEDPPGPKLPQTGQLWWPVPLLLIGGGTMLLLSCLVRRKDDSDE